VAFGYYAHGVGLETAKAPRTAMVIHAI
jgi:hypothetical protein